MPVHRYRDCVRMIICAGAPLQGLCAKQLYVPVHRYRDFRHMVHLYTCAENCTHIYRYLYIYIYIGRKQLQGMPKKNLCSSAPAHITVWHIIPVASHWQRSKFRQWSRIPVAVHRPPKIPVVLTPLHSSGGTQPHGASPPSLCGGPHRSHTHPTG